jgi:site-specific recombinase XerD
VPDWAASTASPDPGNPARRLTVVRGFLRHLSALDGATEVPVPQFLGPTGHRKPPHVYSDDEIGDLLQAAAGLAPAGGLRAAVRSRTPSERAVIRPGSGRWGGRAGPVTASAG